MYRKKCDKCFQPSFSSSEFGDWICPICGKNLTDLPFFSAVLFRQIERYPSNKKTPIIIRNKREPVNN